MGGCINRGSVVASDRIPNQMNRNRTVNALVHIIWKDLSVSETRMDVDIGNSSLLQSFVLLCLQERGLKSGNESGWNPSSAIY